MVALNARAGVRIEWGKKPNQIIKQRNFGSLPPPLIIPLVSSLKVCPSSNPPPNIGWEERERGGVVGGRGVGGQFWQKGPLLIKIGGERERERWRGRSNSQPDGTFNLTRAANLREKKL